MTSKTKAKPHPKKKTKAQLREEATVTRVQKEMKAGEEALRRATTPPPQEAPPAPAPAPVRKDPRTTPVTGAPRARIIRVTISEHWGAEYIPGRGRTYRLYASNKDHTRATIQRINSDLLARAEAAEKEGTA